MKIKVTMHTHRHGVDHYPFTGGDGMSLEEKAEAIGIDYEGEGTESNREDEFLDEFEIDTDDIHRI